MQVDSVKTTHKILTKCKSLRMFMLQDHQSFLATWLTWKQIPQWARWLFPSNKKTNQRPSPTYGVSSEKPFSDTFEVTWQHLEQHNFVFKYNQ